MPRNRREVPREERTGELLAAATEVFLSRGYSGATMAGISEAAGVAQGNLYWYFGSKDKIFAAVMDQMLSREVRSLATEHAAVDAVTRLTRGLSDMRLYRSLHQAMHDRLPYSAEVRAAHEKFLDWIRVAVEEVIAERALRVDHAMLRDLAVAVFEGANVPNENRRTASEMIRFLMDATSAPSAASPGLTSEA